jgi:hypothetical protein
MKQDDKTRIYLRGKGRVFEQFSRDLRNMAKAYPRDVEYHENGQKVEP